MRKIMAYVTLIILLFSVCTGCQCEHEWSKATCTTPKTCIKCGQADGEPLGHSWKSATCTTPKTCKICGLAEGEPLRHTPGKWSETNDFNLAKRHSEQTCYSCGVVLDTKESDLTSFSEDNLFIFSPDEFIQRLEYCAKDLFPEFHYKIDSQKTESVDEALIIHLYFDNANLEEYMLSFFGPDNNNLSRHDLQTPGIWCISLERTSIFDANSAETLLFSGDLLIDGDIAKVFYLACDPILSETDYTLLQIMYLTTYANWLDSGEPIGYHETNGLLYTT